MRPVIVGMALVLSAQNATAATRFKDFEFPTKLTRAIAYSTAPVRAPIHCEKEMLLDLFEPAGNEPAQRPAIVLLHGGAFRAGGRAGAESLADLCEELAGRGYVCASIDYRLEGDDPDGSESDLRARTITAVAEDAAAAIRWLQANAAAHRVDTSRIALGGRSAGAVAALRLAYSPQGRALGVRAVLDLSGRMNGPLESIQAGDAPLLIIHGTNDTLVPFDHARAIADRATTIGLPHEFHFGPGKANGHISRLHLDVAGRTVLDHIVHFFYRYLALAAVAPDAVQNGQRTRSSQ